MSRALAWLCASALIAGPCLGGELDFDAHVARLREKLAGSAFTVVVQPPFVVIGDEPARVLQRRSVNTVQWAVDSLKREYFASDPDHIIDIWLFRDRASYEDHVPKLFGRKPHTPYGYYSRSGRYMAMNIAAGGGTLVHEIVHAFVAANFPQCPAWFNEGLGSLYEQSTHRDGRIVGLANWRLAGLQQAIRNAGTIRLESLTGTDTQGFYGENAGLHYAMARYLCLYLQKQDKLRDYYHAFAAGHADDPTGYATLQRILEESDMTDFQKRREAWVLTLRFP